MVKEAIEIINILREGFLSMSLQTTDDQENQLIRYISEFDKWNRAYNLSAVRELQQMIPRHLLDSLSVVPWLQQHPDLMSIIDVGTGGGLPGIPLSIMFPERQLTLLDSNGKKMRFLFHIKNLLKLDNVTVENRRVETFQPEQAFDAVISRAFASLQDMTEGCQHLLKKDGLFLAMKGLYPQDELDAINTQVDLLETHKLVVADTEGERHLLVLRPR